ncbi:hypothetical protein HHI36_000530 [Cryptolaemus montrouzieri]|uniref:Cyclic nucleotide-binding domain-containing protein n=1 Tax=Cryptolaemus montrouzieri TaxID=559131 RepID=A0ABD2P5L3_9CUCU
MHELIFNEYRSIKRGVGVRRRFKSLIRMAYFNAYWLEDFEAETLGSSVFKNIRVITGRKKADSLISIQQKAILNKREEDRTEAEKRYLSVVFGGMRCFKKYPEEARMELAAVAQFSYFPPKRYVLRENDPPYAWYYILSGRVSITKLEDGLDNEIEKEVRVFVQGYTFGELSLLHNTTRSRSIVTLTHCEFMMIEKNAFNAIIRKDVMLRYNIITGYVKKLPYFDSYDQKNLIEACLVAKVKEFEHDELILGDDVGFAQYTYFIVKGKVKIIQHLMFTTECNKSRGKNKYKLYDPFSDPENQYFVKKLDKTEMTSEALDTEYGTREYPWETQPPVVDYFQLEMVKQLPENVHASFIKIYTVDESGCFNVGENLKHRFVIAETTTNCICLLLPRYWLYKRNTAYIWSRLVEHFNLKIPNAQTVLDEYVNKRKWELRKRKLMKTILTGSNLLNTNSMKNVPYSLRMKEDLSLYKESFSDTTAPCYR